MSPLPPLPQGFTLDTEPPAQGGGLPPLPSGFILDAPTSATPTASRTTPESVRGELGPFNPLELLKKPGVGTTALRVVPQMAGYMLAGPAGGALGAGAGEIAAEVVEGQGIRWPTVVLESGLGAIPGGKTGTTVLRNLGKRALQGGLFGVGGGAARIGLEEGRLPTVSEATTQAVTGAALGGLLGGAESYLTRGRRAPLPPSAQEPPRPLLALPPARPLPVTPEGRVVTPRTVSVIPEETGLIGGMTPQAIATAQQRLNMPVKGGKKADTSGITVTSGQFPPSSEAQGTMGGALAKAAESNIFRYTPGDTSQGYGRRVGYPQEAGTPAEKLFSNFANETRTPEAQNLFRSQALDRAKKAPAAFKNDPVSSASMPFGDGLTLTIDAANSGVTRVMISDGEKIVAAARSHKGLLDSIAADKDYDGVGFKLFKYLDDNKIANVWEVPDRSPGLVGMQQRLLKLREGGAGGPSPGTQPKPLTPLPAPTQAELPPTPMQAKAPQVEHGQLLEGFKPPEKPAPELSLKPSTTVKQPMEPLPFDTYGVPGEVFRGTEAGNARVTLREFPDGELGKAYYVTPHKWLAETYGGGPSASVKLGTRAVHRYEFSRTIGPEDVAYLEGGSTGQSDAVLKSGVGYDIWRGRISAKKSEASNREAMNNAAREAGVKLIIGNPDSVAINQIAILDPSILRIKTSKPSGTVELGMGLPIPEKVKDWLKRFGGRAPVIGREIPIRPASEPPPPIVTPPMSEGQRIRAERRTQSQPPLTPPGTTIGAAPLPTSEVPPFQAAQQRLLDAIKAAKPIRAETERLYSQERGKRLGAALEVGQAIPGKEGYFAQLGKLSGELPKGAFEPMTLDAETVKTLFTGIRESRAISGFDQITAQRGLAKLLGEYGGVVPTKGELELLGRVFPPEFVEEVLKKRGLISRLLDMTAEALAIPKSLMASLDLSASMRQGFTGITAFPRQWGRAFKDQFRYFGSERAYEAMIQEIESRPTFDKMRQAKLALSAVDGTTLTGREEQFMSTLPERITGIGRFVRASDRAYTGFLTKFRADAFEEMLRRAKQAGVPETEKVLADSAKFVNTFTGRGSLGQFEAAGSALSTAFFSPRLMASRFQMLNPLYYTSLDPFVRKQALKAALGTVALGTTVLALAKAGGAKVGTDPRNADFGKVRVGNTRWDVWAGLSHYPRIASQLISGQVVSSVTGKTLTLGEGYKPLTRKDILQRFFENKANPAVGFALRMLEGRGFDGKPITVLKEVRDLFTPMILQDMYDLYNEDPTLLPWATPAVFGIGVQTYGPKRPR